MTTENKPSIPFWKSSVFKAAIGTVLFFMMMFLYANEFTWLQNTFNASRLILFSLLVGLMGGWALGDRVKQQFEDEDERRVVAYGIPVAICLIFPLITSLVNRKLNFNSPKNEQVELLKVEPYGTSRVGLVKDMEHLVDGYSVFFYRNKNLERIRFAAPTFLDKKEGEQIQIPIYKGIFGFEYVNPR